MERESWKLGRALLQEEDGSVETGEKAACIFCPFLPAGKVLGLVLKQLCKTGVCQLKA